MKAIRLKTEHMYNPMGIESGNIRLSWNATGGVKQTAYEVNCFSNGQTIWSSGKVYGSEMNCVTDLIAPRTAAEWTVKLWDENDVPGETSEAAGFECGIDAFTGKWIRGNYTVNPFRRYPVDCFKKEFDVVNVKKARLYITACGLYEARVNGIKAGNLSLTPGHTDYRKRVHYQTYDVTESIKNGHNILTVELADGWFRGSCGAWGLKNQYGKVTKLLAELIIETADGTERRIVTDDSWSWSNDGAIRFADNKDGEIIDANMAPTYSGKAVVTCHKVTPMPSPAPGASEHEVLKAAFSRTPSGKLLANFGQNIAGYIRFKLTGKHGDKIKLTMGELIDGEGELTLKNIQCATKRRATPLQRIEYTLKDGVNEYKTKFAVFGFQYAQIECPDSVTLEELDAIAVYTDIEDTLYFDSSNELLNKFVSNTRWSTKNNSLDVPTDCPTRERHGWTGDAELFAKTALYLFDYAPFLKKYINDMKDGQKRNGCFRQISPRGGVDFYMNQMDGSAGWSDAGVLIPYRVYEFTGDIDVLARNYPAMKRYALYKIGTIGKWYITAVRTGLSRKWAKCISNYGQSYGEWAEPNDVKPFSISDFISPHPEETTAYIVFMLEHMEKIAKLLKKEGDAELYRKYITKTRFGYEKLTECPNFSLDTDRQAKLVRPLYMKLLDAERTEFAKKRLIKALDNYGWRVGTGFLSTPFILYVLADIDIEYAYKLLENEELPGWLCMPKFGANTVWESWEGPNAQGGVGSLDHYSKGAVSEWVFSEMCGVSVTGANSFKIAPKPGGKFTHAKLEWLSEYGKVSSGWKRKDNGIEYSVTVPSNCTAEISLPDGTQLSVTAGTYVFDQKS